MATTVSSHDDAKPESAASAVSWAPIVAGAFVASTTTLILMLVGSGIGLTMVSPWSMEGAAAGTVATSAAIWLVVVQWLSSGLGGYLTGRLRTKWVDVHNDEVMFRDTAHGLLAWALATLLVVGVMGSALSGIVSTGAQAVSGVASGAATAAAASADAPSASNATDYFVDLMFRPADDADAARSAGDASRQASQILIASAASGKVSAEDEAYLARLVAARTNLSQADAEARVESVLTRIEEAKASALDAAETARKASATFALLSALSLVIGAFIASAAAALGGRQRDEDETRYVTVR